MRLIYCHIENFGRLRNLDYTFEEGVNVICRENGWGKSTFSAFLRAMFYGFSGTRRKKKEENERERYRPWQGGIYGGRLAFEAGGKQYEMTRVFGRRESEDEFELRDLATNLLCGDYSSKIGEELFHLNRDSFSRTVFTGQLDCSAAATDEVNALVADLSERAGDMSAYESARKRLEEAANRLSPGRPSGSLYRRAEEIRLLEREASAGKELAGKLSICGQRERDAAEEEDKLTRKLKLLETRIESAAAEEEKERLLLENQTLHAGRQEVRRRLAAVRDSRREDLEKTSAFFPGRVPSRSEVEKYLEGSREMERLEAGIQAETPDEEEEQRLSELKAEFRDCESIDEPVQNDPLTSAARGGREYKSIDKPAQDDPLKNAARRDKERPFPGNRGRFYLVCGVIGTFLFASGLTGVVLTHNPGFAILCASGLAAAAAAGLGLYLRNEREKQDRDRARTPARNMRDEQDQQDLQDQLYDRTDESKARENSKAGDDSKVRDDSKAGENSEAGETADSDDRRSAAVNLDSKKREYERLCRKERRIEELYAEWSKVRIPILRFLKELGFFPQEDLRIQLEKLRDAADDCEDAGRLLREAESDLRSYEAQMQAEGISLTEEAPVSSGRIRRANETEELRRLAGETGTALLLCRQRRADSSRELEELHTEYEEWEYSMQRLDLLRAKQKEEEKQYRRINAAAVGLRAAKEALTARYADPIAANFRRYWERITGYSAAGIRVDAESRVTVEERGKQREISLLSTGYQDLAGICLRVALADAMYLAAGRERPPLIMDDPFTSLDDEKTEGAMLFLREAGKEYQILYFTCSSSRC